MIITLKVQTFQMSSVLHSDSKAMEILQNIVIFLIILGICISCCITFILHIFHVRLSIIKKNLITYFSFLLIHALNAILVIQVSFGQSKAPPVTLPEIIYDLSCTGSM